MLEISYAEALIRIFSAVVAGMLIGFARMKYSAGVRTFTLICFGSAIFSLVSVDPSFTSYSDADATRIISQLVTGIGFLGAGVIWKGEKRVGGLTTAAAIWTTASVGILFGIGDLFLGAISSGLILLVLYSKRYLEPI